MLHFFLHKSVSHLELSCQFDPLTPIILEETPPFPSILLLLNVSRTSVIIQDNSVANPTPKPQPMSQSQLDVILESQLDHNIPGHHSPIYPWFYVTVFIPIL